MKNSELEKRVEMFERRNGVSLLALDWMSGRPRLGLKDKNNPNCIGRFIGPRMTKAQMMFYLDAFEEGYEEAKRRMVDNALST